MRYLFWILIKVIFICTSAKSDAVGDILSTLDKTSSINFKFKQISNKREENGECILLFSNKLKIAFDGDSVLFSDEAERVFQEDGLDAFSLSEASSAEEPLEGGPFKNFLFALHKLQQQFSSDDLPIRTALVTSRGAPAHERVIKTLRHWDIRLDESLFLGGREKGEFLKSFEADIFFDDQAVHCESASSHVASGHVPSGVANE